MHIRGSIFLMGAVFLVLLGCQAAPPPPPSRVNVGVDNQGNVAVRAPGTAVNVRTTP